MLPGETISNGAPGVCPECKTQLEFRVCSSAAGWYIGTMCYCGPYSRESGYYSTEKEASYALNTGTWEQR